MLSAQTIASNSVHPAPALISSLRVRCRINVHVVTLHVTKIRVIFRWTIFELPLVCGDVVPGNRHVECAMQ